MSGENTPKNAHWAVRVKRDLDRHGTFWTTLLVAIILLAGVPQIHHVCFQIPHLAAGPVIFVCYWAYLILLVTIYLVSLFVAMAPYPFPKKRREVAEYFQKFLDEQNRSTAVTVPLRVSWNILSKLTYVVDWICNRAVFLLFKPCTEEDVRADLKNNIESAKQLQKIQKKIPIESPVQAVPLRRVLDRRSKKSIDYLKHRRATKH